MKRDKAIEEVKNYENYPNGLSQECRDYIIKALEQIPKLQNRCHALTYGQMCFFCPYECEHKTGVKPQESEVEDGNDN